MLIFCLFFVYAGWPAPDVNESHYLCKVKQAWNPDWLPGDFFLNTPDAHPVFTATFGWMTLFLSLPAFAWTGRVLTWLALAWAWRRLSDALVSREWYAVLSALLFVYACEISAPAGEWVIGGFEAKGPAYVFVLWPSSESSATGGIRHCSCWCRFSLSRAGGWLGDGGGRLRLVARGRRPTDLADNFPGLVGGFVLSLAGLVRHCR